MKRKHKVRGFFLAAIICIGALAAFKAKAIPRRVVKTLTTRELERNWGKEAAKRILASFERHLEELKGDGIEASGVMRFHLFSARQGLALYRALTEELGDRESAVEATHQVIWNAFLKTPFRISGSMLGRAKDPFAACVRNLELRDPRIFPSPGWEREIVEVENGWGKDYKKCFYYDYFNDKGAPELTPAFCEVDFKQAGYFPSQIEFCRTKTLATGGDLCDFRFYHRD